MFRRAAVPSSAPRALHALSAPASTAAQNQQPKNLQKGCCTNRLNRLSVQRQGVEAYAFEELVAEIGAAFLCAHCGLDGVVEHASYIATWLDALRRDKRLIFVAAGAAQKAADLVRGTTASMTTPMTDEVAA